MRVPQFIIVSLAMIVLLPTVLSIKCFVCNDLTEGDDCGHGKVSNESFIQDCDSSAHEGGDHEADYTICRKIVTWIDVTRTKVVERIVRKCGHLESKYDNGCYNSRGFGSKQMVCSSCTTDECNSGSSFKTNYFITFFTICASIVYFFT